MAIRMARALRCTGFIELVMPSGGDVTAAVIRFSRAAVGNIPEPTREMARLCMLDWFGLTLAGMAEPAARIMLQAARTEGALPAASVLAAGKAFSPRQAALVNGTAGHALDYDDVSLAMNVHPSAVLMPGILALAEQRRLSGARMLEAFVTGYEAAGMIGRMMARSHYARGFHATGTIGTLGAAAACAYLIGLSEEATARALGLAASQAAGLKAQFGTMAKPFHAGRAAEAGLQAAIWAEAGMTARTDILEASQGFADTQSDGLLGLPKMEDYELDRNLFKFHASCFGTHGTLEAIGHLRRAGLRPCDVQSITVKVHAGLDRMCNIIEPRTGLAAKFSLRFNAALALHGCTTADIATYDDAITSRQDLIDTAARVSVHLAAPDWPEDLTEVAITKTDGSSLVRQHDTSVQTDDLMSLRMRLEDKFRKLAQQVIGTTAANELCQVIKFIDDHPIADVMASDMLKST